MIQDTSRMAYQRAREGLGRKQRQVLDALTLLGQATNAELASYLGWPVNRVTPRCLELRGEGLVIDAGRRPCKVTGSTAHSWRVRVVEPAEQLEFPLAGHGWEELERAMK